MVRGRARTAAIFRSGLCERQSTPGSLNEEEWNPSRWKALALLPLEVARTRIGQRRAAVMDG